MSNADKMTDPGDFIIPPEFNSETFRHLESLLTPDEWEKMLNGDPSKEQPLGVLVCYCTVEGQVIQAITS